MHQLLAASTLALFVLPATTASAQPFAEAGTDFSEEAAGPQNLPGRPTRTRPAVPAPVEPEEVPADEPVVEVPREWFGGRAWHDWDRATGDWAGVRTTLEDGGLSFGASYTADWFGVVSGGVDRSWSVRGLLNINATLDLAKAFDWNESTIFADFYWIDGDSISADAGDFQGISNIEAEDRVQLAEIWYETQLFSGLRLKAGKIEANAEFGFVDAAGEFINSSAGFSPTMLTLPSYPDPAFGLVLSWSPSDRLSLTGGFFDGASAVDGVRTGTNGPKSFFSDDRSDDYMLIGEANLSWEGGRAGVGIWHHTGEFERFSGGTESGTTGFYALAEHTVWAPNEDRGIDIFAQFGWSDDEISEANLHVGVGVAWRAPFASRTGDAAGIYASFVELSDPAGLDAETVLELFYRLQVTGSVSVKPDIQFVFTPGGDPAVDDAVVAGVRVEIAF